MPPRKRKEPDSKEEDDDDDKGKRRRLDPKQVQELEAYFQTEKYPSTKIKEDLAAQLGMKPETVNKWFVNRRVKMRAEINAGLLPAEAGEVFEGRMRSGPQARTKDPSSAASSPASVSTSFDDTTPETTKRISFKFKMPPPVLPKYDFEEDDKKRKKVVRAPKAKPTKEELDYWEDYKKKENIAGPSGSRNRRVATDDGDDNSDADLVFLRPRVKETYEPSDVESLPLWRQYYVKNRQKMGQSNADEQQKILRYIMNSRTAQGLPPFFAIITGPTICPYRMEEMRLVLGRTTWETREADIHIGNNPQIEFAHAAIEFDKAAGCYKAVNLSPKGISVKRSKLQWEECFEVEGSLLLSNPCTINIQGVFIYFQLFNITETKPERPERKMFRNLRSYASMIEEAIKNSPGSEATHKEITDYIHDNFPSDIAARKTWKNSVGGVLSSNSLFESIGELLKDTKRSRRSLKTPTIGREVIEI
eukprot:TRINITY_DN1406_c0_g1_i8.p1 TRINITY_DN1406_c0_g1~~TRINITY_DN1406_c0_g1_i8.p1  ORF type:complete len:476 (-),score=133.44 TRINITY_DN1406_c0_g1_i8:253-1680(-)